VLTPDLRQYFNPFSVGVAQSIAELPLFFRRMAAGITLRFYWCYKRLHNILRERHRSLSATMRRITPVRAMTRREKGSIVAFTAGFLVLTIGISVWDWTQKIVVSFS
jgi:uncharacterized ion transporter superfamily protein YfcC